MFLKRIKLWVAIFLILHPTGIILLNAYQQQYKMAAMRQPQVGAVQVNNRDALKMAEKSEGYLYSTEIRSRLQLTHSIITISALLAPRRDLTIK